MEVFIDLPGALNHLSGKYVVIEHIYWNQFLNEILNGNYKYLFENDLPKDYIMLFLNKKQIKTISNLKLTDQDSLRILSAISGG